MAWIAVQEAEGSLGAGLAGRPVASKDKGCLVGETEAGVGGTEWLPGSSSGALAQRDGKGAPSFSVALENETPDPDGGVVQNGVKP